jgi:hypothetical protein
MTASIFLRAAALACIAGLAAAPLPSSAALLPKRGPDQGSRPVTVHPGGLPATASVRRVVPIGDERPQPPKPKRAEAEGVRGESGVRLGGAEIRWDPNVRAEPVTADVAPGFVAQPQYYSVPYDAAIAAGPTQILVVTNNQFGVYDKQTGALLASGLHIHFFGHEAGGGFDPKCYYDPAADRFVMVVLEVAEDPDRALIDIAVTQTGDATGAWHRYLFDATMPAGAGTNTWADFPGLGFDDAHVYLTTNQFAFRDSFEFSRLRVWRKAELYAGAPASHLDFAPLLNADGTDGFAPKPARPLEPTGVGRVFATRPRGADFVTTWTVTGTWPDLVLNDPVAVSVGRYARGRDAPQPGSMELIDTRDCRTHDVVWRGGRWHTAFNEWIPSTPDPADTTGTTALRYVEITDDGVAARDVTWATSGSYLFYPAVSVDPAGNVAMVYGRCSASEYASMYHARLPAGGTFQPSGRIVAGFGAIETGRWGDYNAVANDPVDPEVVWLYGGFGAAANRWGSWVAAARPSQAGPPVAVELEEFAREAALGGLLVSSRPGVRGARVELELRRAARAELTLHDVTGRRVRSLIGAPLAAGRHAFDWDGTSDAGARSAAGVYWVRAVVEGSAVARRIVVLP